MVATLKEALAKARGGDTIEIATDEPLLITESLYWSKPGSLTLVAAAGTRPILIAAHNGGPNSALLEFGSRTTSSKADDEIVSLRGITLVDFSGADRQLINAHRSLSVADSICATAFMSPCIVTDPDVAEAFAKKHGPGGVVLHDRVPRGDLIKSPDIHYEDEVLRLGPISGATPIQH